MTKYSEHLSQFLNFLESAKKDYSWYEDELSKQEALTQDYLHQLELEHLNYSERAKIATKLAACRKARREAKDIITILNPIINYSSVYEKSLNQLKETLGKVRKEEKAIETRSYNFKVLDKEKITNG